MNRLLCRWGLRFPDPEEERAFFASYGMHNLAFARYMLFLGGALFILFVIWDRIIDPVGADKTFWVRVLLIAPAIWLAAAALYWKPAQRFIEPICAAAAIVATGGIAAVCAMLLGGINVAAGGLNLIVLFVFSILPMRTPWYVLFCLCTTISYYVAQAWALPFTSGMPLINTLMLSTAMFLGGASLVAREKSARVQHRTARALHVSHTRVEELLHSMLPSDIVRRIQHGETQIADLHGEVSIIFSDLVGFTDLSRRVSAARVVDLLNRLFSQFDRAAELHGMHKIKTIGDAYMAVGGVVMNGQRQDAAHCAADFALEMHRVAAGLSDEVGVPLTIRVGLHVGAVVAGVIGTSRPAFDCWGEAVNLASRLESAASPGAVLISDQAYRQLRDDYEIDVQGDVQLKGIGLSKVYLLRGPRAEREAEAALG